MANGYLFLLVTNELAQETLDSISFPIKLSIPEAAEPEDYSLGEAEIELAGNLRAARNIPFDEANADVEEADKTAVLLRNGKTHADDEDIEIFNAYKVEVDNTSTVAGDKKTPGRFRRAVLQPLRKIIRIELAWVKMEIEKPDFILGDPILIKDMVVRLQVKFRACAKFFGKRLLKTFTTELLTLEARQLKLELQTRGTKVSLLPSFTDVDVVLNFSIFGLTFTAQPGITTIINRQLHKKGPMEIMDLGSFEKEIPFGKGKLGISSIAFAPDPKGLVINMIMGVV
jgi:hypothetical protein